MFKHIIILMCLLTLSGNVLAEDWTKWRGPHANSSISESGWNPKALEKAPKIIWKAEVGMGHSAVAVRNGRLFTMGNDKKGSGSIPHDIVVCLDIETGKNIWSHDYPCKEGEDPGPGSTPVLDGDRLYTLSRDGHLFCFNAENGDIQWKRHLVDEGLVKANEWGFSSSPVILNNHLFLNVNKNGIAFNKYDGELLWNSDKGECAFNSPILFQHRGKQLVGILTHKKFHALNPNTGEELWTLPLKGGESDPTVIGDRLLFADQSSALVDLSRAEPEILWKSKDAKWIFQSCSIVDGFAYGFGLLQMKKNIQHFQCIDIKDGSLKWKVPFEMWGSSIAVDDKLIILTGQGRIIVAQASSAGLKEISSAHVVPMADNTGVHNRQQCHCWTYPVFSEGRLYARNSYGTLVCLDMR